MVQEEVVETLNDLIRATEDSHELCRRAAELAEDRELKLLFNDLSAERGGIVRDLQQRVAAAGGTPQAAGSILGGARRAMAELKSSVLGDRAPVLIEEVERREAETARRFEEALARGLPPHVAQPLADHLARIRAGLDRLAERRGEST